jgi:hypothetical protein
MTYKYLASPYTDKSPDIMEIRFQEAERCLSWLLKMKIWAYAPIVHCHALAKRYELPKDHVFWRDYDRAMILGSSGLLVLKLGGWDKSKGVQEEIEFARDNHLFVRYIGVTNGEFVLENFG